MTVIDQFGGWGLCQNLTDTVHFLKNRSIHIAEYWMDDSRGRSGRHPPGARASTGSGRPAPGRGARGDRPGGRRGRGLRLARPGPGRALSPAGFPAAWRSVHCVENHDIVFAGNGPRVARLSDSSDTRSWYARSRSRVATGLLLTAPGIPLMFMGQEFLEDKQWSDSDKSLLIYWEG